MEKTNKRVICVILAATLVFGTGVVYALHDVKSDGGIPYRDGILSLEAEQARDWEKEVHNVAGIEVPLAQGVYWEETGADDDPDAYAAPGGDTVTGTDMTTGAVAITDISEATDTETAADNGAAADTGIGGNEILSVLAAASAAGAQEPESPTHVPCGPITNFKASTNTLNIWITLTWKNPNPALSFIDVTIIKNEGRVPSNINDGIKLYQGKLEHFVDSDVKPGTTYYYRAFTYYGDGYNDDISMTASTTAVFNVVGWEWAYERAPVNKGTEGINQVAYGNGMWVGVGWGIYSSPDTKRWNERMTGLWFSAVEYGNGRFVAISEHSATTYASLNGTSWVRSGNLPNANGWMDLKYANGTWIAVAQGGGIARSTDGELWEFRRSGDFRSVAYLDGEWLVVSKDSAFALRSSTDGLTWETAPTPPGGINYLVAGNGVFVGVRFGSAHIFDGSSWKTYSLEPYINNAQGIAYGYGLFVAVGNRLSTSVATAASIDGVNWKGVDSRNGRWENVDYGDGKFVAVGETTANGNIIVSTHPFLLTGGVEPGTPIVQVPELTIIRESDDGEKLRGARFRITGEIPEDEFAEGGGSGDPETTERFVIEIDVDEEETLSLAEWPPGIYTVEEIRVPNGYKRAASQTFDLRSGDLEYTLIFRSPPNILTIIRLDENDNKIGGSKVRIVGGGRDEIHEVVDGEIQVILADWEDDDYTVTEIEPPDGYPAAESEGFKLGDGILEPEEIVLQNGPEAPETPEPPEPPELPEPPETPELPEPLEPPELPEPLEPPELPEPPETPELPEPPETPEEPLTPETPGIPKLPASTVEIRKVDAQEGFLLPGMTFGVYKMAAVESDYEDSETDLFFNENGTLYQLEQVYFTTATQGTYLLDVSGFDDGKYVIMEIEAPMGYQNDSKPVLFEVENGNAAGVLSEFTFKNNMWDIPQTGYDDDYTWVSAATGTIAVAAAATLQVVKGKKGRSRQ